MSSEELVSILIPTHNRTDSLPAAIASALEQDYKNTQVIVIRDGGADVSFIIDNFDDERLVFINRAENRGKPFSLNQAIGYAEGKYICYLDDDDIWYPNHVSLLADALENQTDCQLAYSDLYRTYTKQTQDGRRIVLGKTIDISRDFDRFMMLCFNHVLHVSMMHHKSLLDKTGLYNEKLNIMIDWDIARRMSFFTDFYHVRQITGEFNCPVEDNDRISVKHRENRQDYLKNLMLIRTTRPAKPWCKVDDVAVIILADKVNSALGRFIKDLWQITFWPNKIYIPIEVSQADKLEIDLPNVFVIKTEHNSDSAKISSVLQQSNAEYIAVVSDRLAIKRFWLEDCINAILSEPLCSDMFVFEGSDQTCRAGLFNRAAIEKIIFEDNNFTMNSADLDVRHLQPEEISFQYDQLFSQAETLMQSGEYQKAGQLYEYISANYGNSHWLGIFSAKAYFKSGDIERAEQLAAQTNANYPNLESVITLAKCQKSKGNHSRAIELFENALSVIEGKNLTYEYRL